MQPKMMIAIDPDALEALHNKLDALTAEIRAVRMSPSPEWVTANEYAKQMGVTRRTVTNWISRGEIQSSRRGATLMVRVSPGASPNPRRSHADRA